MTVAEALEHPETIPFLGGEDRAQKYLARHEQIYGKEIGIWLDIHDYETIVPKPKGMLLQLGWYGSNLTGMPYTYGLKTSARLDNPGHFLGVPSRNYTPEDVKKAIQQLEELKRSVDPELVKSLEELLSKL